MEIYVLEISLTKELQEVADEIAYVSGYMWERDWAERNAGNFSVDVTRFLPGDINNRNQFQSVMLPISQPELAGRRFIVKVMGAPMRNVARHSKKHLFVILWEKHGCAAVAADIAEAFDYIDIIEKAATIFFVCKSSGNLPQGINDEQLAEITSKYKTK